MKHVSVTKIVLASVALLVLALGMSALKDSLPLTKGTVIKPGDPAVQALKKKRRKKRYWAKKETSINESMQAGPTCLAYDQASKIWFAATDGKNGQQLWSYDITSGTTQQVIVNPLASAQINSIASDPNACYFSANRRETGQEVHQYTPGGGVQTYDINPGSSGSYPSELLRADSSLFFSAQSPGGTELYRLNIPTGQWKYYNLNNDPYCTLLKYMTLGPLGRLFFQGYYPGIGTELAGSITGTRRSALTISIRERPPRIPHTSNTIPTRAFRRDSLSPPPSIPKRETNWRSWILTLRCPQSSTTSIPGPLRPIRRTSRSTNGAGLSARP